MLHEKIARSWERLLQVMWHKLRWIMQEKHYYKERGQLTVLQLMDRDLQIWDTEGWKIARWCERGPCVIVCTWHITLNTSISSKNKQGALQLDFAVSLQACRARLLCHWLPTVLLLLHHLHLNWELWRCPTGLQEALPAMARWWLSYIFWSRKSPNLSEVCTSHNWFPSLLLTSSSKVLSLGSAFH